MLKFHSQPRKKRIGTIAVMAAVTLTAVVAVLALSLDAGSMMAKRRSAQAAADAGALAAAADLFENYWTYSGDDTAGGAAKTSALAAAKDNGFENKDVTVNIPPKSGYYIGRRGYAEVIIEYKHPLTFASLFSNQPPTIKARAVAIGAPIAADVGILVLEPTNRSAFNAQGSGVTTVNGTPVVVNSIDPAGGVAGGGGTVMADKFVFAGGYTTSGGGSFVGPIYTNRPPMLDPLAHLPEPDPSTMVQQSNRKIQATDGEFSLQPGVYKGGIKLSGTASLNLEPGIYYMDGGGFEFAGQGSLVGNGVMIYANPIYGLSDRISVAGQGRVELSGMTEGKYQGITFFQQRNSNTPGNIAGNSEQTKISGTFYFAGALLNISGNGEVNNIGSQYISRELNLGGNGDIYIDWRPDLVGRKRSIYLVE